MPYYDYRCRECGDVQMMLFSVEDVEPVVDSDCAVCEGVTRFDRTYKGYAPGIGRVPGAGGSPSR